MDSSAAATTQRSDEARRRDAEALARARRRRFLAETALSLALPLLAWKTGLAAALASPLGLAPPTPQFWGELGSGHSPPELGGLGGTIPLVVYLVTLLVAYRLALLPLGYFAGYRLSRRYGLTT